MAIYSVEQILKILIDWEKELLEFYQSIEGQLEKSASKQMISVLKKEQENVMKVLNEIDLEEYKDIEFDKNLPNYQSEQVISQYELNEESDAKEIIEKVFDFEEEFLAIYNHIKNIVVYEKSKDVFKMLYQFKLGQVKKLKSYMDSFEFTNRK